MKLKYHIDKKEKFHNDRELYSIFSTIAYAFLTVLTLAAIPVLEQTQEFNSKLIYGVVLVMVFYSSFFVYTGFKLYKETEETLKLIAAQLIVGSIGCLVEVVSLFVMKNSYVIIFLVCGILKISFLIYLYKKHKQN